MKPQKLRKQNKAVYLSAERGYRDCDIHRRIIRDRTKYPF